MSDNRALYIEETIIGAVKRLLAGRVNELVGETEHTIPAIEFGRSVAGGYAVTPVVRLSTGERTEKERIIRLDVYALTITFAVPEGPEAERNCYAYAGAVATALGNDPALGGTAGRAELTGKRYDPPQRSGTGGEWETVLTLRITMEEIGA
jgi:hypothetical protein